MPEPRCHVCSQDIGPIAYPVAVWSDGSTLIECVQVCDGHGEPPLFDPVAGRKWINETTGAYWKAQLE